MKFLVHVFTRSRPALCLDLVEDLRRWSTAHVVEVVLHCHTDSVYEYEETRRRLQEWSSVRWVQHPTSQPLSANIGHAFSCCRQTDADYVVFLPDDVRTCRDFFGRVIDAWRAAEKLGRVGAINLLCETKRDTVPNWTGIRPVRCGPVTRTGWVDGAFVTVPAVLKSAFGFVLPRSSQGRRTSVWAGVSRELQRRGWPQYRVHESLLCHVYTPSVLHEGERRKHPGMTTRFIDGLGARRAMSIRSPVYIGMATTIKRYSVALRAAESLAGQGQIDMWINGREGRDYGDAGKFHALNRVADNRVGYYLTVDDDIVYPPDYVERIVQKIELYGRRAAISWHGMRIPHKGKINRYFRDRVVVGLCRKSLNRDAFAHVVGTGVLGFHSSTLEVSLDAFENGYMADVWFATICNAQQIPRLVSAHPAMKILGVPTPTLFHQYKDKDAVHTRVIRQNAPWPLLKC